MKSRKNLLKRSQLYLILDKPTVAKRSLDNLVAKILHSEIGIVQLRDKYVAKSDLLNLAVKLSQRFKKSETLFIVNDHLDIAILAKADGLHLGQMDLPISAARKLLGKDKIIGVSCHNLRQAIKAQKDGADYIGIGPVYKTSTKPGSDAIGVKVLEQLKNKITIPYFAIGNICRSNIKSVVAAGATRIAACRAILNSKNIPKAAAELLGELRV
jgi:thiamine-phosphate pyrophosphorylase